jgi:hypothetical protein
MSDDLDDALGRLEVSLTRLRDTIRDANARERGESDERPADTD